MIKFDEVEYRGNLTKQIAAINKGYEYAKEITADGYSNIFFVAVGGTMAMMLHFAAIAKQKTKIPVYVEQAAELVVAGNTQLNKDSLVIMGSKSGDLSLIHISEPTRQAEISYAVFCLKKKKKKKRKNK